LHLEDKAMYTSLKAHIENGKIILDEPISFPEKTKVIVTILEEVDVAIPDKERLAVTLRKIAKTKHSYLETDPMVWQKEIRKDRKLPGRD